ncbi:MAG: helix-turn-helix domain-containing protein [Planctomycetaceae bacterium]|jgi:hypothetical protein|nr:helix-turn-helix domain-containing protein [Planctomycetaceae bacterium]
MMVKAAEYYNLEKTAEVLSLATAEVNRLREQGKLRGLRDGSNWKFLKDEIHSYLAEQIRARGGHQSGSENSGSTDSGDAASSSFDLLMENVPLPGDSQLVSVSSRHATSDIDLAAADDDLALAEETIVAAPPKPKAAAVSPPPVQPEQPKVSESGFDLAAEDSSGLVLADAVQDVKDSPDIAVAEADIALADADDFDVMNISEATHVTPVSKLNLKKTEDQEDEGSDFLLAEETHVSSVVRPGVQTALPSASDFDLVPLDDSDVLPQVPASEVAGVSIKKDNVRKGEGSSPQLGLAGQSGLDNLAERSSGVTLLDQPSSPDDSGIVEFTLEPSSIVSAMDDNSESSSQVIAIGEINLPPPEDDPVRPPAGGNEFGDFDNNFNIGTDSGDNFNPPAGGMFGPHVDVSLAPPPAPPTAPLGEEYTTASLVALALAVIVLIFPAIMMVDTVAHIWSWGNQPFILNSWLMGWFKGWLGLS